MGQVINGYHQTRLSFDRRLTSSGKVYGVLTSVS
jgi:hypothetical protein